MARIAQIISTARYLPEHLVTNAELTARFTALGKPHVIDKLGQSPASASASTCPTTGGRREPPRTALEPSAATIQIAIDLKLGNTHGPVPGRVVVAARAEAPPLAGGR